MIKIVTEEKQFFVRFQLWAHKRLKRIPNQGKGTDNRNHMTVDVEHSVKHVYSRQTRLRFVLLKLYEQFVVDSWNAGLLKSLSLF